MVRSLVASAAAGEGAADVGEAALEDAADGVDRWLFVLGLAAEVDEPLAERRRRSVVIGRKRTTAT